MLSDHLDTEQDHASIGQVVGSLTGVGLLIAFALTLGRRSAAPLLSGRALPAPWIIAVLSYLAAFGLNVVPETWLGVSVGLAVLSVSVIAVRYLSRSPGWTGQYIAALATGALLARATIGFFAVPLGDVAPTAKYAHNVILLLLSAALGGLAIRQSRIAAKRGDTPAAIST